VVVADVDGQSGSAVVDEIRAAGGHAEVDVLDLTDADACGGLIRKATAVGPLRVLVNAAGVMVANDTVEDIPDDELERLIAVNVMAVFRVGRHAIPAMRAAGGGVIVNTTSVHAYSTMDRCAAYAASKGALCALTRQMAIDVEADAIRVVAIAPGSVDTPLTRAELARRGLTAAEAGFEDRPGRLGRIARPEEVAEVIAWLITPEAALVNGSTVIADAGLLTKLV
jgi:NAD(P)-dependent dehydrogenase (short-subunit alcohol dehydrogenase family)